MLSPKSRLIFVSENWDYIIFREPHTNSWNNVLLLSHNIHVFTHSVPCFRICMCGLQSIGLQRVECDWSNLAPGLDPHARHLKYIFEILHIIPEVIATSGIV